MVAQIVRHYDLELLTPKIVWAEIPVLKPNHETFFRLKPLPGRA